MDKIVASNTQDLRHSDREAHFFIQKLLMKAFKETQCEFIDFISKCYAHHRQMLETGIQDKINEKLADTDRMVIQKMLDYINLIQLKYKIKVCGFFIIRSTEIKKR